MEDHPSFLQSLPWERFQQRLGRTTYWLDDILFIERRLPWGRRYWYGPRTSRTPDLNRLDAAFKRRSLFVRLEPTTTELPAPWRTAPTVQPRQTLITDLLPSTEALLEGCKPKTRYNIRLAERKGVTVVPYAYPESSARLGEFMALTRETNLRDQISSYASDYYAALLEELGKEGGASLLVAYREGQPLAALIMILYQETATYLFGASSNREREAMAPYLLQWTALTAAQAAGAKRYDWWGVKVEPRFGHGAEGRGGRPDQYAPAPGRAYGVTRFKMGFGGHLHFYPPAGDRVYRPFWYNLYRSYQSRSTRRGFAY